MTIDWKKPIEATDGRPARVLATDLADTDGNCVLVAIMTDGSEILQRLRPEGWSWPHREAVIIRNKRTKREGWVNVWSDKTLGPNIHATEAVANAHVDQGPPGASRSDCIRIEWEE